MKNCSSRWAVSQHRYRYRILTLGQRTGRPLVTKHQRHIIRNSSDMSFEQKSDKSTSRSRFFQTGDLALDLREAVRPWRAIYYVNFLEYITVTEISRTKRTKIKGVKLRTQNNTRAMVDFYIGEHKIILGQCLIFRFLYISRVNSRVVFVLMLKQQKSHYTAAT